MLRVAASPLLPSVFILYLWLKAAVKCYLTLLFFYSVATFHPHCHIFWDVYDSSSKTFDFSSVEKKPRKK